MPFWKPGRKMFSTAAILMMLMAVAHTLGMSGGPEPGAETNLFLAMAAQRTPMALGMNPSLADIFWALAFTMSITVLALGALNLTLAASDLNQAALRNIGWVNAIWVAAFTSLNGWLQVLPPFISGLIIEAVLVAWLVKEHRSGAKY